MKEVIAFWDKPEMLNKQEVTLLHFNFIFSTLIKEKMFKTLINMIFSNDTLCSYRIRFILDFKQNFCDLQGLLPLILVYIQLGDLLICSLFPLAKIVDSHYFQPLQKQSSGWIVHKIITSYLCLLAPK